MSSPAASLEALRLESAALEIEIIPGIGGRLHRLRAFGHDVLRTPADPELHVTEPFSWGAYHMVPWCGRLDARPVRVRGRTVDLASNFPDGTVIHGQCYARPWTLVGNGTLTAKGGGDGWPWPYEATAAFEIAGATLRVSQSVLNLSDEDMPAGIGLHPWFDRSTLLEINAAAVYTTNSDSPAQPIKVSGRHDLRVFKAMAEGVDATWTDLGTPAVRLAWPALGLRATMTTDPPAPFITAALPTAVGALAVEPQTHAPQGLRRLLNHEPGALALLAPGQALAQTIEMSFERIPRSPEVNSP